jgi:ribosomal protein L24E
LNKALSEGKVVRFVDRKNADGTIEPGLEILNVDEDGTVISAE